jgi:hypothetical protein
MEYGKEVFELLAEDIDNEYAIIDPIIVRVHQNNAGGKKIQEEIKLLVKVAVG